MLYGTQEIPELEGDHYWTEILEEPTGRRIRTDYESDPYLGIFVAISDDDLADRWNVPFAPCRQVIPFDDLLAVLAPHIEEAQRLWQLCQEEARKHGSSLPDGKLLMVWDYD